MQETTIAQPADVEPRVFGNAEQPASHRDAPAQDLKELLFTRGNRRWGVVLLITSITDIFISGVVCGVAFDYAYLDNGVSLYCLGLQVLSHWITSVLLLLRLAGEWCAPKVWGNHLEDQLLVQQQRTVLLREQALSIVMALAMLLSAAALVFKAARKIKFWDVWHEDHEDIDEELAWATKWLAMYGVIVYSIQSVTRGIAACFVRRLMLTNALVVSIVTVIFCFVMGIAWFEEAEWSWKAEPLAALFLAMLTIVEAIRIVYLHFDNMEDRIQYDQENC